MRDRLSFHTLLPAGNAIFLKCAALLGRIGEFAAGHPDSKTEIIPICRLT